jgi:hypothetical protein
VTAAALMTEAPVVSASEPPPAGTVPVRVMRFAFAAPVSVTYRDFVAQAASIALTFTVDTL